MNSAAPGRGNSIRTSTRTSPSPLVEEEVRHGRESQPRLGNRFWNTYYTSFEQILSLRGDPGSAIRITYSTARGFWSHAFADFAKLRRTFSGSTSVVG